LLKFIRWAYVYVYLSVVDQKRAMSTIYVQTYIVETG